MDEDDVWRKRLLIYTLVRLIGVVIVGLGVAIVYSNLLRRGGWPQVGAIVAILGVLFFFVPRLLHRSWKEQDSNRE